MHVNLGRVSALQAAGARGPPRQAMPQLLGRDAEGWPLLEDPFCLRDPHGDETPFSSGSVAPGWTPVTPARLGPPAPPTYAAGFITPDPLPWRCAGARAPQSATIAGVQACRSGTCTPASMLGPAWPGPAEVSLQVETSAGASGSAADTSAEALPAEELPGGPGLPSAAKRPAGDGGATAGMPAQRRRLTGKQPPPPAYVAVLPQMDVLVSAEDVAGPGGLTKYRIRQRARWLYGDRRAAEMNKQLGNYAKRRAAARRQFATLSPEEQQPYLLEAEQAASQ